MDLLARALDCGMLGWAGIRAPSSKDLGMEVGSWTLVVGHAAPTAYLTAHKYVWCDNWAP